MKNIWKIKRRRNMMEKTDEPESDGYIQQTEDLTITA